MGPGTRNSAAPHDVERVSLGELIHEYVRGAIETAVLSSPPSRKLVTSPGQRLAHVPYVSSSRCDSHGGPRGVRTAGRRASRAVPPGRFPKAQWKTLRTTNVIERLHEEFRRRVKTQGSLPSEDAALILLFSLVASGQIKLRRIDGWRKIAAVLTQHAAVAA